MKNRKYGFTSDISVDELRQGFDTLHYVKVALLFGSRASNNAHRKSDYDFALAMNDLSSQDWGMQAKAWMDICEFFNLREYDVDVIDFKIADKLLLKSIKEKYIVLKGDKYDIRRLFDKNLCNS